MYVKKDPIDHVNFKHTKTIQLNLLLQIFTVKWIDESTTTLVKRNLKIFKTIYNSH